MKLIHEMPKFTTDMNFKTKVLLEISKAIVENNNEENNPMEPLVYPRVYHHEYFKENEKFISERILKFSSNNENYLKNYENFENFKNLLENIKREKFTVKNFEEVKKKNFKHKPTKFERNDMRRDELKRREKIREKLTLNTKKLHQNGMPSIPDSPSSPSYSDDTEIFEFYDPKSDLIQLIEILLKFSKKFLPRLREAIENFYEDVKYSKNLQIETSNLNLLKTILYEMRNLSSKYKNSEFYEVYDKLRNKIEEVSSMRDFKTSRKIDDYHEMPNIECF